MVDRGCLRPTPDAAALQSGQAQRRPLSWNEGGIGIAPFLILLVNSEGFSVGRRVRRLPESEANPIQGSAVDMIGFC